MTSSITIQFTKFEEGKAIIVSTQYDGRDAVLDKMVEANADLIAELFNTMVAPYDVNLAIVQVHDETPEDALVAAEVAIEVDAMTCEEDEED